MLPVSSLCSRVLALVLLAALFGAGRASAQSPSSMPVASLPAARELAGPALPRTEVAGDTLMARGRYLAAMEVFSQLQPKTAAVYNKLGIACEHMRMEPEARLDFEKAVQQDPRFAEAYNNLGTLYHSEKDYRHAEKFYKKAIRLDPRNAIVEENLGTLYYARGKFDKGDQAYRRALAIDPDALKQAAEHSIAAATDAKGMAALNFHVARAFAQAGNNELALAYLQKAVLEGFKDRKQLLEDPDFAGLRKAPGFSELLADLARN